jgi:E3 ubiquitin-protein ligase HUWE1
VQDLNDLHRQTSSGAGEHMAVTDENKERYVSKIVDFRLKTGIAEQAKAFQRGVYDFIPLPLLQVFSPAELELLHCGISHIDVDDLQRNSIYRCYNSSSDCIRWFWELVRSYDEENRSKLLQFVTGTTHVPHEGFKHLPGGKLCIARFERSQNLLTSHTCFNRVMK